MLCICMLFALGTIGEMPNFFDFGSKTRVENLLIGFSSKLLVFRERKDEKAFARDKEQITHIALL